MNKNLKRMIAIALAIGTISAVTPVTNMNVLTTKAYASSDDDNDDTTLESLKLNTSKDDNIKLYKEDDYSDKVDSDDVSDDDTYYAKTSSKKVKLDISGPKSRYVKVFKGTKDSSKGKSISDEIELDSGTNTITIKVYSSKPDSDVRYDDSSASKYVLKIKYTGSDSSSSSDDDADQYDSIYLDSLSVEGNKISLSDSKVLYSYDVASNVKEVTVKAQPQSSNDIVKIDGTEVDEDDKYKKTISLDKDKTEFDIKVTDSDDEDKRVYTLTINRGSASAVKTDESTVVANSQPSTATTAGTTTTVKTSQWVQINGGWQYNDSLGSPLKNQWFLDRNLGKWYYLGVDGMMAVNTYVGSYRVGADGAWIQ